MGDPYEEKNSEHRTDHWRRAGCRFSVRSDCREYNKRARNRSNKKDDSHQGANLGTLGGRTESNQMGLRSGVRETRWTLPGRLDGRGETGRATCEEVTYNPLRTTARLHGPLLLALLSQDALASHDKGNGRWSRSHVQNRGVGPLGF